MKGASVAVTPSSVDVDLANGQLGTGTGSAYNWKYASQVDANSLGALPTAWSSNYPTCAGTKQSPIDVVSTKLETPQVDVGKVVNHLYELAITGDVINTGRHLTYQVNEGLRPYISGGPLDSK